MHVFAFGNVCDDPANVLTVLDHGGTGFEVLQRNLVADGDVLLHCEPEIRVIGGNHAEHPAARCEAFNDNDADIVRAIMNEQLWGAHVRCPPMLSLI
jgi:hypothetical protein